MKELIEFQPAVIRVIYRKAFFNSSPPQTSIFLFSYFTFINFCSQNHNYYKNAIINLLSLH